MLNLNAKKYKEKKELTLACEGGCVLFFKTQELERNLRIL